MTIHLMAKSKAALAALAAFSSAWLMTPTFAQDLPITSGQQATANDVAQKGVPLSDLAPGAPERYTVVSGDTLWAISEREYGKGQGDKYNVIFEANRPMLTHPDKIYPGQVLRVPPLPHAA